MSEVNNVSSNASFDARINASADAKSQRDSTVQEDGKQSNTQDSTPKSSSQSKNQERRDSAVTEMIKTLQQEQVVEDIANYRQNVQELYRQRNQQASEEYMERLKSVQTEQTAEVVEERKEVKDVHHKYNERVQDLSRKHLSRLLKGKLEESTFKDLEKVVDPEAAEEKEASKPANPQKSARSVLNKSHLRPEVSHLIERNAQNKAQNTAETPVAKGSELAHNDTEPDGPTQPKYDLMESALSKLRNRLGGAHENTQKQAQQTQQTQNNDQIYAQKQPLLHTEAPIRANMGHIQQDIQRSRQLAEAADGSRYIPLENSDIEKLLTKYKIPFTHAMIQTIKQSSQKLQDSSYFFLRGASILAHTGIEATPERAELVSESLRLYEKYERPSTMNKLYRYLINSKYLEIYKQLKTQDPQTKNQGFQDIGRSLFDAKTGKPLTADNTGSRSTDKFASLSFRNARGNVGPGGLQLPTGANPEALGNAVKAQLQDLGLPANRVMVRQIVQSADGDVMRAQALLLQLASGGSLSQAAVEPVYQALLQLPAEAQDAGPLELMKSLHIPIPERLLQNSSPSEQKFAAFLAQLGLPPARLEGQAQTREALVNLHSLSEKTNSTEALVHQLSKALTTRSDFWMKQLSRHLPRITDLNQALTSPRFGDPSQQKDVARALILAMEMPEGRTRSWERVRRVFGELSETPLKPTHKPTATQAESPTPETAIPTKNRGPEDILARYGKLPFAELAPLTLQNQAKEALLLLHTQAQKLGIDKSFQPMVRGLLNGEQALEKLQLLGRLLPQLQRQLQQGFTPTGLQHIVQNLQPERSLLNSGLEQEVTTQYPRLSTLIKADAIPLQAAQEALLLLHSQAQLQQQQPQLAQVLNSLSPTAMPTALTYLTQLLPHLQQQTLSQNLSLEAFDGILRTLKAFDELQQPLSQNTTTTTPISAPPPTEASPFLAVLSRFYPQLEANVTQALSQQLQQASPDSLKGFFQLHQMLGQMDPLKAQSLGSLWQIFSPTSAQIPAQGRLLDRLAHLSKGLTPLLNATPKGLSQSYALSPAQQNQFIQGLQTFLQSGNTQTLKPVLLELLATPMVTSPLNKVKEQIQPFQLAHLSPGALENIWQLSQGSRLRVDAMAVLLKGNYPLLESNITQMVSLLERMPAHQRADSVHDILLQFKGLSEALPTTLAQMQVQNPLTQLRSLLESSLPLLAQHFNPASTSRLPAQDISVSLNTSPNQLLGLMEQISTQLSASSAQGLAQFKPVMAAIQNVLQQLNGLIPSQGNVTSLTALQNLQQAIQNLQQILPQSQAIQSLGQQLQAALGTGTLPTGAAQSQNTVAAFQTQLMGFLHELGLLSKSIDQRMGKNTGSGQSLNQPLNQSISVSQNPSGSLSSPVADAKGPALLLPEGNLRIEDIQKYLQQWGLQAQSPEGLQQVMQLMQGQQERLDAMAILLKGNMPLLPAHIQVIAQYVKSLPREERFQSISKVLSFLSDALIAQMKGELQAHQKSQRQQLFPGLPEDTAESAENHALQARKSSVKEGLPFSAQSYTTAAYAAQSSQAGQKGILPLPLLQNLLHNGHLPEHFLLPLERIMGQLASLFPRYDAPESLQGLQDTLSQLRQTLQPAHTQGPALGQWMQAVGAQIQRWDQKLQQQVQQLAQRQRVPFEKSNWIESLLASLLGITDTLAQEDPGKGQQLQKLRQSIQEQLHYFKESLQSLEGGQQQLSESSQPLQYIPAYLEQLGMPVEMLIQPEKDDTDKAAAENFSEVLLNVKTHTLGDVHLQLRFDTRSQKLSARMGLSSGKLLRHIQPLLASFQDRMHTLPFEVMPLQTYIIDTAQQQQTVMARRLYRRLSSKAIDSL